MGKLQIVVGGQAGSEGKGAIAAHLARPQQARNGIAAVRVAGPNAGHSAVAPDGTKWALRQIPVAAVVNPEAILYIAAGSEIDVAVLNDEVYRLEAAGIDVRNRLIIDRMATVLEPRHHDTEAHAGLTARIGSTSKGIGAARSDRIMRTALTARHCESLFMRYSVGDTADLLRRCLLQGQTVQLEGTQGHWLGLHHENYPQVTSSDCRAIDFAAMAGLSPWAREIDELEVWVVYRPWPIRVAGNSGPLKGETTWEALGQETEYTTVTHKPRRVGVWDAAQARAAIVDNGGPSPHVHAALTMADKVDPTVAGVIEAEKLMASEAVASFIGSAQADIGADIRLVGTSDRTVVEL